MNCPICSYTTLKETETTDGLKIFNCEKCGGNYLKYQDYNSWLKSYDSNCLAKEGNTVKPEFDSKQAKLCPECGRILIKYKIDKDTDFFIDYCKSCGSVWFDKDEFEFIKNKGLHNKIHLFFTGNWQQNIKDSEKKDFLFKKYTEKLGESDHKKIQEIKSWIDNHEKKKDLIAYLLDDDPYNF